MMPRMLALRIIHNFVFRPSLCKWGTNISYLVCLRATAFGEMGEFRQLDWVTRKMVVWQLVVGHVHREYTCVAEKYMGEAKKKWYF